MFDYEKRLAELAKQTVLCVGDLMLDRFIYGDVGRISPEAPAPVIRVRREESAPGGAGNVARNIAGLGARCILVSAVGDDDAGRKLAAAFGHTGGQIDAKLAIDASRPTTEKARFVSEQHSTHLLRADWEDTHPLPKRCEDEVLAAALKALAASGALVLSDYGKGVLTPRVIETLIEAARKAKKPVIVDPKHADYRAYRGATLITPNRAELSRAAHRELHSAAEIVEAAGKLIAEAARKAKKPVIVDPKHADYRAYSGATLITPNRAELSRAAHRELHSAAEIVEAAGKLIAEAGLDALLITRSEEGMTLVARSEVPLHIPSHPVKVRDVSGAGDTVVATIAAMLAMGAELEAAARTANAAAAVVIGKPGTAAVNFVEMRAILVPSASRAHDEKIVRDPNLLEERLEEWRSKGLRIGFTNGCFDLIHPGHLKVLAGARAACDRLIVGLNSDASARRLKGAGRPIQDEVARAEVLAALEAIDLVVPFEEDTPIELIRRVKPAVLVKGGDYTKEQVVGREIVEAIGGEVVLVETLPERSTTRLVERSRGRG